MNTVTETSLRLERVIPADPGTVFDAWTQPRHMLDWCCPEGMRVDAVETDLRVGGSFRILMRGSDGEAHTACGAYREIERPRRLVYTWMWEEKDHDVGETLVTVVFNDLGGSTGVVLVHELFPAPEAAAAHEEGWSSCLDRLGRLLD